MSVRNFVWYIIQNGRWRISKGYNYYIHKLTSWIMVISDYIKDGIPSQLILDGKHYNSTKMDGFVFKHLENI